ncbi:hypothetical protein SNEBB_005173 [Seison nebaliae]|nr:hypothetical protein SNEBB_005173 [Seison nebaliae]
MDDLKFNDPLMKKMWYVAPEKIDSSHSRMGIKEAWSAGYSGKNIVITIIDDGIERSHPDLRTNYDKRASIDLNDRDDDPTPRYDLDNSNRHGTRCAGVSSAVANNSLCGMGIAFNSKIGGIRMLDGDITDALEAISLMHQNEYIDIYSSSWGPEDNGRTLDGPGRLANHALIQGIVNGRKGKGVIYVWASGNGGLFQDNCGADGYVSSIYTVSIGSITINGRSPYYVEKCTSTIAVTYSSGNECTSFDCGIVSTDLHNKCTYGHSGTSASAPLAAGIIALILEANPNLGWRDVQHIIIRSATLDEINPRDALWRINGVGRRYSHLFGYGLMNAKKMVDLAENWKPIKEPAKVCIIKSERVGLIRNKHANSVVLFRIDVEDSCNYFDERQKGKNYSMYELFNGTESIKAVKPSNILEHVQIIYSGEQEQRGRLKISLISPSNTLSILFDRRTHDHSNLPFDNWFFSSLHFWGENPFGRWIIKVEYFDRDLYTKNRNLRKKYFPKDFDVSKALLVLWGTDNKYD